MHEMDIFLQVEKEEVDKLKEEAEHLNENNIRKLPKNKGSEESETPDDSNSDASTDWEGSDDPDYGSKGKPVVVKIKKEPRGSSSRNRKRPSFFQVIHLTSLHQDTFSGPAVAGVVAVKF